MKRYEVNITINGVTSEIDTITVADNYTAEDYVRDCEENADSEWCEMLRTGDVTIIEID